MDSRRSTLPRSPANAGPNGRRAGSNTRFAGLGEPAATEASFKTLWDTEREWTPTILVNIDEAETAGVETARIGSVDSLDAFREAMVRP